MIINEVNESTKSADAAQLQLEKVGLSLIAEIYSKKNHAEQTRSENTNNNEKLERQNVLPAFNISFDSATADKIADSAKLKNKPSIQKVSQSDDQPEQKTKKNESGSKSKHDKKAGESSIRLIDAPTKFHLDVDDINAHLASPNLDFSKIRPVVAEFASEEDRKKFFKEDPPKVNNDRIEAHNLFELFEANFSKLDRDGDGFVSEDEIDHAITDSTNQGQLAQMVTALKMHQEDLEELSNDETGDENYGISLADMRRFDTPHGQDEVKLANDVQFTMDQTRTVLNDAERTLYGPSFGITAEAIDQGIIGDCYFLSALASLAEVDPLAIACMIRTNSDGTYTVDFPGAEHPVTVTAPTDSELALYNNGGQYGIWGSVMEKAYGAYCNETWSRRSILNLGESIVPYEGADGGSIYADGLRILTEGDVDDDENFWTKFSTMDAKLQAALTSGRPVTAYSIYGDGDYNIVGMHEYAVLEYDPVHRAVKLYNPWGHHEPTNGSWNDGNNDGFFWLTLEEFDEAFTGLSYAERGA